MSKFRQAAAFALLAMLPALAAAQDSREALQRAIGARLGEIFGQGGTGPVVERLMAVKPGPQISRNFDMSRAMTAAFGRQRPALAPDCRATVTPAGEPDQTVCLAELGNREAATGSYTMLAFSKNIALGDIAIAHRPAFELGGDRVPAEVKMSDAAAYEQALKLMETLGVPMGEIPTPPRDVAPPVRGMVVGATGEQGDKVQVVVQKVVTLQRAFPVPGGLLQDSQGRRLDHVLAPGRAMVAMSDSGVHLARVHGWVDAQMDPRLGSGKPKPLDTLSREIADDLHAEGVRAVGTLSILIALRRAYPNPDDPNPPLCPVCGVLRPALMVLVSQAGRDQFDSSEKNWAAPGVVREYDLVEVEDAARAVEATE